MTRMASSVTLKALRSTGLLPLLACHHSLPGRYSSTMRFISALTCLRWRRPS
jgi:hypothetical protein